MNIFESGGVDERKVKEQGVRKKFETLGDGEGRGIDGGIKEAVIALELSGLHPQASCEGHTNRGQRSAPWVEMGVPNEPDEQFVGQNEAFQEVAEKYGYDLEKLKRSFDPDKYWEAMNLASSRAHDQRTEEFQEWEKRNKELLECAKEMVERFYNDCGEPKDSSARIQFDEGFSGEIFRIYSGGEDYAPLERDLSEEERMALERRLMIYRAEMERFSRFLLDRYHRRAK